MTLTKLFPMNIVMYVMYHKKIVVKILVLHQYFLKLLMTRIKMTLVLILQRSLNQKSVSGEDSDDLKDKDVFGGDSKDESKEKPKSKCKSGENSDDLKDTGVISHDSKDESKEKPESKCVSGEDSDDLKDKNVFGGDSKDESKENPESKHKSGENSDDI